MHHRAKDLTGQTLGYLTAIRYSGSDGRRSMWEILCVCGQTKLMDASEFTKQQKKGIQASCGCMRRASISSKNTKHGMSRHPAYAVWRSMLDRCRLPSHKVWERYGGRGIKVCTSWQRSFDAFWTDMGPTYLRGLTLERTNNSKGYSPANCVWASRKQQAANTRATTFLNTPAGRLCVSHAADLYGVKRTTLQYRLRHGWPVLRALNLSTTS